MREPTIATEPTDIPPPSAYDSEMGYELREHTADIAVAATGDSLEAVFGAVADGFAAASCESVPDEVGDRFESSVTAESREALLFDYLDDLVYQRDVRAALPVDHHVDSIDGPTATDSPTVDESDGSSTAGSTIDGSNADGSSGPTGDGWSLEATARGVPLAEIAAREIKAVTYSEMRLERANGGWEAYVVFDV